MEEEFNALVAKYGKDEGFFGQIEKLSEACKKILTETGFQEKVSGLVADMDCAEEVKEELLKLSKEIVKGEEKHQQAGYSVSWSCNYTLRSTEFSKWYNGDDEGEGTTALTVGDFLSCSPDGSLVEINLEAAREFYDSFDCKHVTIYRFYEFLSNVVNTSGEDEVYDVGAHPILCKEAQLKKFESLRPLKDKFPKLFCKYLYYEYKSIFASSDKFDEYDLCFEDQVKNISFEYNVGSQAPRPGRVATLRRKEGEIWDHLPDYLCSFSSTKKNKPSPVAVAEDDKEFFDKLFEKMVC